MRRRSEWEHKLNARGSAPSDYARYAEYEMNLEALRRKRVQRLGVKVSNHTGQRRIFFILDRATRKFQGDIGLWMQYINFARRQRSNKKVSQILTSVLRLHPTNAALWIYAANYALEERGDMTEARSYMQRALRFCKTEEKLWVEYAKLEMMWIAKIVGRRKILGLEEENLEEMGANADEDLNLGKMMLPKTTSDDTELDQTSIPGVNDMLMEELTTSPALSGAIPMAIYDAAMMQFDKNEKLQIDFYDMAASFPNVPCTDKILSYMMEGLTYESPEKFIRYIRQPSICYSTTSPGFPTRLGICLERTKDAFKRLVSLSNVPDTARPRSFLAEYVIEWLLSYLEEANLDPDIRKVILMTLRTSWAQLQESTTINPDGRGANVARLIGKLQAYGIRKIADPAIVWATDIWPNEPQLSELSNEISNQ